MGTKLAKRFGWNDDDEIVVLPRMTGNLPIRAAGWEEDLHPRGYHGEFGDKDGMPTVAGHHPASAEERHALRIPPAWQDVTVADDQANAEVLARGRDGKGRVQAIYSAKHNQAAAAAKFERVNAFAAKALRLDVALKTDAAHSDTAAAVLVMRRLGIRVGSDNDTHAKQQAYGTTTLQARHVEVIGDHTTFDFIGKKGVHIRLETDDPDIADAIRPRLTGKGPGDRLFATNEQQTIAYLRSHTGPKFKNHDLRTLLANEIAQREVNRDLSPAKTKAELARRRNAVGDVVAAQLGNNRSEALKSYVNPAVFRQWDPESMYSLAASGVWEEAKHPRGPHGEFGRVEGWVEPHDGPSLAGKVTPTGGRYKNELYPPGQPWRPERSPFDRFGNYAADNLTRQKTIDKAKEKIGDPKEFGLKRTTLGDDSEIQRYDKLLELADERIASLQAKLPGAPDSDIWEPETGRYVDSKENVQANIEQEIRTKDRLQARRDEYQQWRIGLNPEFGSDGKGSILVPDRAKDGGPGPETMAKLKAIQDAGTAIKTAVEKTLEGHPAVGELNGLNPRINQVSDQLRALRISSLEERDKKQDIYAQGLGYKDSFDLFTRDDKDPVDGPNKKKMFAWLNKAQLTPDENTDEVNELAIESASLRERRVELRAQLAAARRDTVRAMVAGHRSVGGLLEYDGIDTSTARGRNVLDAMDHASHYYPTDWVNAIGRVKMLPEEKRGWYKSVLTGYGKPNELGIGLPIREHHIALSDDAGEANHLAGQPLMGRVAIHETGHAAEKAVPGLSAAEWAYYWKRTSTGNPGTRKQEPAIPMAGYVSPEGDPELARSDRFVDPYVGKTYGNDGPSSFYELFTTGIESVFAGSPYTVDDAGFETFILGVLVTL